MVCAACKYIYDPTMGPADRSFSTEFMAEVGGMPFMTAGDLPDVYACPMCGTLKFDITGAGMEPAAEKG